MQKVALESLKPAGLIYSGESSKIFTLDNKTVVKIASPLVLHICQLAGTSYERKILDTRAQRISEIISPISAVYANRNCVGYTMEKVSGHDLNSYDDNFTLEQRSDLHHYFDLYRKIEDIVMKANKEGIVIPDLCTCDNIVILPDGSLRFIDYDGMQFGEQDKAIAISTSLGDERRYISNPKYCNSFGHFTSELDKTSLVILMFLVIFNVDLTKVGTISPIDGKVITIEDVFQMLGIDDRVFMKKVAANISANQKGVYLQDELYKISQEYNMQAFKIPLAPKDAFIKKLTRK